MGFGQGFSPNAWVALPNHCTALQPGLHGHGTATDINESAGHTALQTEILSLKHFWFCVHSLCSRVL